MSYKEGAVFQTTLIDNSGKKVVFLDEPFIANKMMIRFWGDPSNNNRFRPLSTDRYSCLAWFYMDVGGNFCERCQNLPKMGAYMLL